MAFEKQLQIVKAVLTRLNRQPMRWTPLLKATINECGNPPRLYYTLKHLEKNGHVERLLIKNKPHWVITEKGKRFLEAIS
jgi:DNA-binding PadR family transcriptional regulator